jgi:hypothetical protein
MTSRRLVAHCDWSKDPRKRWMAVAIREGEGWRLHMPEPVGTTDDLIDRLARRTHGGVLVGFDFPIGVPSAYGMQTGLSDFTEALRQFGLGEWRDWYDVCGSVHQISRFRPFYPQRPGGTSRAQLFGALGLTGDELLRLCERATPKRQAACMLFWTLGGNQVGKGAITGWNEVIAPNIDRIGLWPFAGTLAHLDARAQTIIVETYPGEVYQHLGIPRRPVWSKRRQEGRRSVAGYLLDWIKRNQVSAGALADLIRTGFSSGADGEDQFDAVVGLFGMLDVVAGHRIDGAPLSPAVTTWEGWILGQQPAPILI